MCKFLLFQTNTNLCVISNICLCHSYFYWARAAGGMWVPFLLVLAFAGVQCISVASTWWLTYWSAHGNQHNQVFFLGIYGAINIFNIFGVFLRLIFIMMMGLRASRKVSIEVSALYSSFRILALTLTWNSVQ